MLSLDRYVMQYCICYESHFIDPINWSSVSNVKKNINQKAMHEPPTSINNSRDRSQWPKSQNFYIFA